MSKMDQEIVMPLLSTQENMITKMPSHLDQDAPCGHCQETSVKLADRWFFTVLIIAGGLWLFTTAPWVLSLWF